MSVTTRINPLSYLTEQLDDLKAKGTYFRLRVLEDEQAPVCTFDGRKVINLASNNYLGLTTHPRLVFRHKDIGHAEEQLASVKHQPGRKLLISDGVFSMDGDIGPLPQLCDLAERYGAIMMVDDAHASGVLGRNGRGTIDHFNVHGRVDLQVGTLSKAVGALGGYVCGSRDLIDFLYHRARPFLFSTSHPPSVAATCIAAFEVLENEPDRIEKLWENTRFWKKELGLLGFDIGGRTTPASETPITPIIIGDSKLTMDFSRELFQECVLGTGITFPTVPEGKARIRTIMTATHKKAELDQALEVLKKVGKRMGILA